jgi:hypothetical protein
MAESAQQGGNVFISYSRVDVAFADQLRKVLLRDFAITIDRESITAGDNWKKRLGTLIRDADTIVFVLSPSSVKSETCAWEVAEAVLLGKRIIPVLCSSLDGAKPPQQLADLDHIFFYAEPTFPGSGFGTGLIRLVDALNTNLDWLREHTRYLRLAKEWEEVGKPSDRRLLSAVDIAQAKAWAGSRPTKAPEVTALQFNFIEASETEDDRRKSAEAQRLREVEFQLDRANRALADAINNDLLFERGGWAPRTRNALWRLAVADEAVKGDYVTILSGSPEETVRAAPGFAQISRALGLLRPSPNEVERLVAAAISALSTSRGFSRDEPVFAEIGALAPKLTGAQAAQALDQVLNEFGKTDDPNALRALAKAIQALPVKLTDAQAVQAVDPIFNQFLETDNILAFQALAEAIQALPVKLTDAQAGQAVDKVLNQIGKTHNVDALATLAQAIQALLVKLADAQTAQALDQVLNKIRKTTDPLAVRVLARAIEALAVKLMTEHAAPALDQVLNEFGKTDDPYALRALAKAIQALPVKLTDAQAGQAVDKVLNKMCENTLDRNLPALEEAIQALAPKLSLEQGAQALDEVLSEIGKTTDRFLLEALAKAIQALPGKLSDAQAARALDPVLVQLGNEANYPNYLGMLAEAIQALPIKPTHAQVAHALYPILHIGQMTNAYALEVFAKAITALAPKLTDVQASQALDPILQQFR